MPSALEKLVKILKLERNQGYKDTAVIGGLGAFANNWRKEAHQQARIEMHHLMVDDLSQLMEQYAQVESRADRHEMVSYMLDRVMMRINEPRPDFVPRHDWETTPDEDDKPKDTIATKRRAEKKDSPKAANKKSRGRTPEKEARPEPPKRASESQSSDSTAESTDILDMEFTGGSSEPDIPPEKRLERPPRLAREPLDPEAAADALYALQKPVISIKGIGKRMAEKLERLGLLTIEDMLYYQPRRYDDYTRLLPIMRLQPEQVATVIGTVRNTHLRSGKGGRKDFAFSLDDGSGHMDVIFFGQHWLRQTIRNGDSIVVSGKIDIYHNRLQTSNPDWEPLDSENLHTRSIVPVYGLTKGLNAKGFRVLMKNVIDFWPERIPDFVPQSVLDRCELADLSWALQNIHFPEGWDYLDHARRRLAFDELLLIQLTMLQNRRDWQSVPAMPIAVADGWLDSFTDAVFSYELTGAQQRAVNDILQDIALDVPMNRLVQGDVGSGKTAVAMIALGMAVQAGQQAAFMAPTSILAEQHYRAVSDTFAKLPTDSPIEVALLTGAVSNAERERVYAGLADGSIHIVVGTHAVIQQGVEFANLGLAIIDEQHRFGVEQRGALRGKGQNPHLLVMTATPIPRTLTLTQYADLDLSIIDEMPPGRTPVQTRVRDAVQRELIYDFIKAQLDLGRQAFAVYPLVEASEKTEAESAVEAFDRLKDVFYQYRVGLLHGRMKASDKEAIMRDFANHEFDLLVSTSVTEVGVNIPNASVMLIEGANRFGLSQLHQFRGRVGRGEHPGYCILVPDKYTPESAERLLAMQETHDGFLLAEYDWKTRGAGDVLGTRQSGKSVLQSQREMTPELVELSIQEARTLFAEDPDLSQPEHHLLQQRVQQLQDKRTDMS